MVGKKLSQYQIIRKIGSGGMGDVFLAEDTSLNRKVAIKILAATFMQDTEYRRRFFREAKAVSLLDHPHIAHVYEIGESEGTLYIVLQFIDGETLQNKIRHQPFRESEMIDLAIQIAGALQEAHSKGIVHRDLKPSNILVNSRGEAMVLDFGLAKAGNGNIAPKSALSTVTGIDDRKILGTVSYMSPEQALGEKVDQRSDLFNLGLLLYEMTTGRPAFSAENAAATLYKIVHDQPESIARFNTSVSLELERIIRKCLQKDKERRYQSARDLLVDLRNLLRQRTTGSTVKVDSHRLKIPWKAVAYISAALFILMSLFLFLSTRNSGIHSLAVLPFTSTGDPDESFLGEQIAETLIGDLSRLPEIRVLARSTVLSYQGKIFDPRQVGRDLNVDAVLTGAVKKYHGAYSITLELVNVNDGVVLWGDSYQEAGADLQQVQENISREISRQLSVKLAEKNKED